MENTTTSAAAPRAGVSLDFADALTMARHSVVALGMAVHGLNLAVTGRDQGEALSLLAYQAIDAMDRLAALYREEAGR